MSLSRLRPNFGNLALVLTSVLLLAVCQGCNRGDRPPIGRVKGVVTMDGQPVAGVGVIFSQPGFRSSFAMTNDNGEYDLQYIRNIMGAAVGNHRVWIEFDTADAGPHKNQIPPKYNRNTELTAEVKSGRNTINFELSSD